MSSPRPVIPSDGVLLRDQHGHQHGSGPVLLPRTATAEFIEEFNRTYARIGLAICRDETKSIVPEARVDNAANGHRDR